MSLMSTNKRYFPLSGKTEFKSKCPPLIITRLFCKFLTLPSFTKDKYAGISCTSAPVPPPPPIAPAVLLLGI